MQFHVLPRTSGFPASGVDTAYLRIDHWNDYSFVTMFDVRYFDIEGVAHELGQTKIAFEGQTTDRDTYQEIPSAFERLDSRFFSVGQDVDFYKKLSVLPARARDGFLSGLRDLVISPTELERLKDEKVLGTSLLRYVSVSTIKGQFARVLAGYAELTDFKFSFVSPGSDGFSDVRVSFVVQESSMPSTNIHAVIGRNGVGKTTLLNGMINAIAGDGGGAHFVDDSTWGTPRIDSSYFSSLVSVSFSAFDPFVPPREQGDPAEGACYFYVGLKSHDDPDRLRSSSELRRDCSRALVECFSNPKKMHRWLRAIEKLSSDEVFESMGLAEIPEMYREVLGRRGLMSAGGEFDERIHPFLARLSSGHAIVLLTISRLVATVEEKTLVLLDEPESHLHPPLLSAFVRALSDLLHDRNGVAIIATHSPVVLQEIPKKCVIKMYRVLGTVTQSRPDIETFGENVGLLTSEVFGLEVARSGFHDLLSRSVARGKTYEEIIREYDGQLGLEGRAVLAALISERGRGEVNAAT